MIFVFLRNNFTLNQIKKNLFKFFELAFFTNLNVVWRLENVKHILLVTSINSIFRVSRIYFLLVG